MTRTALLAFALGLLAAAPAHAACAFQNQVPVRAYFAGFPAWKAISAAMKECGNFTVEHDQEIRTKGAPALAANPALYHIENAHNGTITPLLNQNTIRPLDDLIAKYGQNLKPNQLIRINGRVMAIAVLVNMQHLQYRTDILEKLGIPVPDTYEDVIAAAKKIQAAGVVQYPLGMTWKADWNIGIDFNNFFAGFNGKYVNDDNTPAVNSDAGRKALEMMKSLVPFMDPAYLTADATFVQQQFQQEKIALSNFWVSRVDQLEDPKESRVVGKIGVAAAPRAVPGGVPAVQYSWDAIVIARNITDAEAEAAFRVAMAGIDRSMVEKNNGLAIWLLDGYKPGPLAQGAIDTMEKGAPSTPTGTWRGLLDDAVSKNVPNFLLGKATAEETLKRIEADYLVSARTAGLITQ